MGKGRIPYFSWPEKASQPAFYALHWRDDGKGDSEKRPGLGKGFSEAQGRLSLRGEFCVTLLQGMVLSWVISLYPQKCLEIQTVKKEASWNTDETRKIKITSEGSKTNKLIKTNFRLLQFSACLLPEGVILSKLCGDDCFRWEEKRKSKQSFFFYI